MARTTGPLPMFFRPVEAGAFEFQIQTSGSNYYFYLPLGATGTYDFMIDWGDGSEPENITSYNGGDNHHIYTTEGSYAIKMTGECTEFDFQHTSDNRNDVTAINNFLDLGFVIFNFKACNNLTTIANNMSVLTHLTNVAFLFSECAISALYEDMFSGSPGITTFEEALDYLPITSIPANLFQNNTSVTNFDYTFSGCTSLTGNAPTLWLRDPLPSGTSCFSGCTGLTNYASIPSSWGGGGA